MAPWLIGHPWAVIAVLIAFVAGVIYAAWQQVLIEQVEAEVAGPPCQYIVGVDVATETSMLWQSTDDGKTWELVAPADQPFTIVG